MAVVSMYTQSGEQHGLMSQLPNSVEFDDFKNVKAEHRESLKKKMKDEQKLVKARYINRRGKHERLEKPYCRWPGEPIQIWKFIPEEVYMVPLGLVNEVNESRLPVREGLQSVDGRDVNNGAPLARDETEILHEFVPVGF